MPKFAGCVRPMLAGRDGGQRGGAAPSRRRCGQSGRQGREAADTGATGGGMTRSAARLGNANQPMAAATRASTAPSPNTAANPTVAYSSPPRMFAMIAAIPNAVVWNRAWPVACRSAGRRAAIVSTVPTTTPANATPVIARVAMIAPGLSSTVHDARHAAYSSALPTKIQRSPNRRAAWPASSIAGISAAADTPDESATSRQPASSTSRRAEEREPRDDPDVQCRDGEQHERDRGATLSATPSEPIPNVRRGEARSAARRRVGPSSRPRRWGAATGPAAAGLTGAAGTAAR